MRRFLVLLALAVVVGLAAYALTSEPGVPGPSPTPSGVGLGSPSRSSSPSPTPTPSPTPSPSPTPTPSPSPSPTPSPTPSPSPTPITFVSPDGYTLVLPSGWLVVPVTGDDIGPLLDLLGQSQPDVARLIRAYLDASGAKVSLLGVDPELAAGGLPPSAIVLLQPTLGFSLDFVGGVVGGVLGRVPGVVGSVQKEKLALSSGDAIRFTFDTQTAAATGNIRLVQYLIVRGSQGYVVTFTTQAGQVERDGPVFDRIIGSLTFP